MSKSNLLLTAAKMRETFGRGTSIHDKFHGAILSNVHMMSLLQKMFQDPYADHDEVIKDGEEKRLVQGNLEECYLFFLLLVIGGRLLGPKKETIEQKMELFCDHVVESGTLSIPSEFMDYISSELWEQLRKIDKLLSRFQFAMNQDIFHLLYQDLMLPVMKKNLGAYFTPPSLAQLMIREIVTSPRQKILDPACGTGIFLVEAFNRQLELSERPDVDAILTIIENIQGFDLNLNAVLAATINLLIQLKGAVGEDFSLIPLHFIRQHDALCLSRPTKFNAFSLHSFDVVIGNPPWKVLNSFKSKQVKERLKELAKEWNVLPPSHQVSHLEISSLFFEAAKHWYLKPGGYVFLVMSHSLLTGDNHSKTRRFDELVDVEIWTFQERIFPIPFCCVKGRYTPGRYRTHSDLVNFKISMIQHETVEKSIRDQKKMSWKKQQYIPSFVDQDSSGTLVGRYVPQDKHRILLKRGRSPYHSRCFAGATLFPRNLLFVSVQRNLDGDTVLVRPIIKNAKQPWHFNPLRMIGQESIVLERKYIFPVVTSKEILPFVILHHRSAFLPIEREVQGNGYRKISDTFSRAWKYYLHLENLYAQHRKSGALFTSLWNRLNYQQCLTHSRQRARVRVLMPQSGQLLKAAVLEDSNVIVDYTSYLIPCDSIKEAHYLAGILNSPLMNETIKMIKADRHIQKRPLEFPCPKFDPSDSTHKEIARLGEKMHSTVQRFVNDALREGDSISRIMLQRKILKRFEEDFSQLNEVVLAIFERR